MEGEGINVPDSIRIIAAALQESRYGLKIRTEQRSLFKNVKSCFLGNFLVENLTLSVALLNSHLYI